MMNAPSQGGTHPNLERYYDRGTDRSAVDRHIAGCPECRTWLDDIHERLGHLHCVEFVELVTDYLEDALEPPQRARVDDHLRLCEGCRNYQEQVQATIATIGHVSDADATVDLPEDVRAGLVAAFRLWRRQAREERPPEDG